jgi:hypothetical protein
LIFEINNPDNSFPISNINPTLARNKFEMIKFIFTHGFSFLLLLSFALAASAQEEPMPKPPVKQDSINLYAPSVIDNEELNRLYVGCDNLYHYRGMGKRKLIGKMGEKVVEQRDGFFIIRVALAGKYAFSIYDAATSTPQLVEEKKFEAIDMPDPIASIAGKSCGFISEKELQSADSLNVQSKKQTGNRILSFRLTLVNGKIGRVEYESKSNKLTAEMKSAIAAAGPGTTVLFEYIRALIRVRGAGVSMNLPSVSFILED